jgi:hypothetical protein
MVPSGRNKKCLHDREERKRAEKKRSKGDEMR